LKQQILGSTIFWGAFLERADEKGFPYDQVPAMLDRLMRTGFYLRATPAIGEFSGYGTLGPDFDRFLEAVQRYDVAHPSD